ncbi:MAG: Unknown protein [uncultured Sulfurovum sp.]|uniref:Uncharacterized protein n=1 Tax=uncultured Sulfurovum sp. TaxID=269237 RepID=A0A6S6TEK2_9BACT|nr:MAG: Unknown protein [uncultured Sulfurovum sp.]
MFTVEVLISIFILFLVVTLSATSSKFLNQILKQQERYKTLYSTVFSIKDSISNNICREKNTIRGEMRGLEYIAKCTLLKEERGFQKDYDFENNKEISGNIGLYVFGLYEVELEIVKYNYKLSYVINQYKKSVKQ